MIRMIIIGMLALTSAVAHATSVVTVACGQSGNVTCATSVDNIHVSVFDNGFEGLGFDENTRFSIRIGTASPNDGIENPTDFPFLSENVGNGILLIDEAISALNASNATAWGVPGSPQGLANSGVLVTELFIFSNGDAMLVGLPAVVSGGIWRRGESFSTVSADPSVSFPQLLVTQSQVSPVPLPGAVWLFLSALGGLTTLRKSRMTASKKSIQIPTATA